jgi:hypothetical protein
MAVPFPREVPCQFRGDYRAATALAHAWQRTAVHGVGSPSKRRREPRAGSCLRGGGQRRHPRRSRAACACPSAARVWVARAQVVAGQPGDDNLGDGGVLDAELAQVGHGVLTGDPPLTRVRPRPAGAGIPWQMRVKAPTTPRHDNASPQVRAPVHAHRHHRLKIGRSAVRPRPWPPSESASELQKRRQGARFFGLFDRLIPAGSPSAGLGERWSQEPRPGQGRYQGPAIGSGLAASRQRGPPDLAVANTRQRRSPSPPSATTTHTDVGPIRPVVRSRRPRLVMMRRPRESLHPALGVAPPEPRETPDDPNPPPGDQLTEDRAIHFPPTTRSTVRLQGSDLVRESALMTLATKTLWPQTLRLRSSHETRQS